MIQMLWNLPLLAVIVVYLFIERPCMDRLWPQSWAVKGDSNRRRDEPYIFTLKLGLGVGRTKATSIVLGNLC